MGGHGAWILAINNPNLASCIAPAAGWIRKEQYGSANAFFVFDIQDSFIDPSKLNVCALQSHNCVDCDGVDCSAVGYVTSS
jgi:hypothetical protein